MELETPLPSSSVCRCTQSLSGGPEYPPRHTHQSGESRKDRCANGSAHILILCGGASCDSCSCPCDSQSNHADAPASPRYSEGSCGIFWRRTRMEPPGPWLDG